MFHIKNNSAPRYLSDLVTPLPIPRRTLRSSNVSKNNYIVPFVKRKTFAERSFAIQGPRLWNGLPEEAKQISNLETFKSKLKTILMSKQ